MKPLSIFLSVLASFFLTSCETGFNSLAGTTWRHYREHEALWFEMTIAFTATQATITQSSPLGTGDGERIMTVSRTVNYTYDSPDVSIERTMTRHLINGETETVIVHDTGTVKGRTMSLMMWESLDLIGGYEFKLQR